MKIILNKDRSVKKQAYYALLDSWIVSKRKLQEYIHDICECFDLEEGRQLCIDFKQAIQNHEKLEDRLNTLRKEYLKEPFFKLV